MNKSSKSRNLEFSPGVISPSQSHAISKIALSQTFYPVPSEFKIAGLDCNFIETWKLLCKTFRTSILNYAHAFGYSYSQNHNTAIPKNDLPSSIFQWFYSKFKVNYLYIQRILPRYLYPGKTIRTTKLRVVLIRAYTQLTHTHPYWPTPSPRSYNYPHQTIPS